MRIISIKIHDLTKNREFTIPVKEVKTATDQFDQADLAAAQLALQFQDVITVGHVIAEPIWAKN